MAPTDLASERGMPVELKGLSLKEWLAVCEHAEGACVRRFQEIAAQADPQDKPLQGILRNLASEEEGHLAAIRDFCGRVSDARTCRLDGMLLDHVVRLHFPSFSQTFGEGRLSRDNALYFAECLEKESSRFYRGLSDEIPDPEARDFFLRVAEGEESHLKHIQTTLL